MIFFYLLHGNGTQFDEKTRGVEWREGFALVGHESMKKQEQGLMWSYICNLDINSFNRDEGYSEYGFIYCIEEFSLIIVNMQTFNNCR